MVSLYYQKRPRGMTDRTYDEQIVMACGEKLAYGYRRRRGGCSEEGLPVRKRVLRVMQRGLLVRSHVVYEHDGRRRGRVEAASRIKSGRRT